MTIKAFTALLAVGIAGFAMKANATQILFGSATGEAVVHYNNNGGGENPLNQAYIHVQNSNGNNNGANFTFNNTAPDLFGTLFGDVGQFGFDMNFVAPTNDGSNGSGTPIQTYDNTNGTQAGRALSTVDNFAISNYQGFSPTGPQNSSNEIINTLIKGNGIDFSISNFQHIGTVFSFDVSGTLTTDGFIHWYNPSTPDSSFASGGLSNDILVNGSFSYNTVGDTSTNLFDVYSGTTNFYFQTLNPVPEPATLSLIGMGIAGLGTLIRRRKLTA